MRPLLDRISEQITRTPTGCWQWNGWTNQHGYGRVGAGGRGGASLLVHRVLFEIVAGPIPAGLELDHLCRNHRCVNPAHLEPVTHAENMRRGATATKTHCVNGHAFDEINTAIHNGARRCRSCHRTGERLRRIRR